MPYQKVASSDHFKYRPSPVSSVVQGQFKVLQTFLVQLYLGLQDNVQQSALTIDLPLVHHDRSFKDSQYFLGGSGQSLADKISEVQSRGHFFTEPAGMLFGAEDEDIYDLRAQCANRCRTLVPHRYDPMFTSAGLNMTLLRFKGNALPVEVAGSSDAKC